MTMIRPTRFSLALGVAVIAFWALLWSWFLLGVVRSPEKRARQPGEIPELARMETSRAVAQRTTAPV